MTEDEAYKVHIQYTFNAFCKIVIRHAAIDMMYQQRYQNKTRKQDCYICGSYKKRTRDYTRALSAPTC